jgi:hypothetical protein
MNMDELRPIEVQLLAWFQKRPMQKIAASELRDGALEIWGRKLEDGPRVARSLWERGLLERQNGTRAPYWYVPTIDHHKSALARQRALLIQAHKAAISRLIALAEYSTHQQLMGKQTAIDLSSVCKDAIAQLKKVKI